MARIGCSHKVKETCERDGKGHGGEDGEESDVMLRRHSSIGIQRAREGLAKESSGELAGIVLVGRADSEQKNAIGRSVDRCASAFDDKIARFVA